MILMINASIKEIIAQVVVVGILCRKQREHPEMPATTKWIYTNKRLKLLHLAHKDIAKCIIYKCINNINSSLNCSNDS